MAFALGFILGFLVALLPDRLPRKRAVAPPPDEDAQRRHEQALREYRNFMTYDGFSVQEED